MTPEPVFLIAIRGEGERASSRYSYYLTAVEWQGQLSLDSHYQSQLGCAVWVWYRAHSFKCCHW